MSESGPFHIVYYQNVLSVIPKHVRKIVWNEYYLSKPYFQKKKDPNWFKVLFQYSSFKWALSTAIATLFVLILMEMRRRQRYIPVIQKPVNDSLDFVTTMGRLYYDKKDHKNLAKKMAVYFLEHIRSYKISVANTDDSFVKLLHLKTGYSVLELQSIVSFINYINTVPAISEKQLTDFHSKLELFYEHT
ncbi:MAG: hypothetical protein ICV66_11825 [Chitinophagaceae bacterium]|nr:hypothetical protein [Chitinophagaceae bacterium]